MAAALYDVVGRPRARAQGAARPAARAATLPVGWEKALPSWEPDPKGVATRKASGEVLNALADVLPELWGGSADLAESNNTTMEGANSFGPKSTATQMWDAEPYGRTLHFGVREHAMGAILNGIALHGPTRPYGGTFLHVLRLHARRRAARRGDAGAGRSTCGRTTRSASARTARPTSRSSTWPRCGRSRASSMVRPGDANETACAWKAILEHADGPRAGSR